MKSRPFISIVIPAWNYANTLRRAVTSVTAQMNSDIHELLVIDDGSTDETPVLAEILCQEFPGKVRFIRQENAGPASARNHGIRETKGEWLIFLDADDELFPTALKTLAEHLRGHPESRLVIGGHVTLSSEGKQREHSPGNLPEKPLDCLKAYLIDKKITISNGACAMHRDVFAKADFPEFLRNAEDLPVFAQALANYPCTVLPTPLAIIHKHNDSLRHRFDLTMAGGLSLVDEVFSEKRLGSEFQALKPCFLVQRCLSLFRRAYIAGDFLSARHFYKMAIRQDWKVIFRFSYTRKALQTYLKNQVKKS